MSRPRLWFNRVAALGIAALSLCGADAIVRALRLHDAQAEAEVLGLRDCRPHGAMAWVRHGLPVETALEVVEHEAVHIRQCLTLGILGWTVRTATPGGRIDLEAQAFAVAYRRMGGSERVCPWVVVERLYAAYPDAQRVWPGAVVDRAEHHCRSVP